MFYGDNRDDENPQDFLKMVETSFDNNPNLTEAQQCKRFRRHCRSAFEAEEWYDTLTATTTTDWDKFTVAFNLKWPAVQRSLRSAAEKKAELLAERLEEKDLMTKVERNGVQLYTHIAWANRVDRLAAAVGDPGGLLISVVHKLLPRAIRDLVGDEHTGWPAFTAAVCAIAPSALKIAIEKEQRFRDLEKQRPTPQSPTAAIRQALERTTLSSPAPQRAMQRIFPTTPSNSPQQDPFTAGGPPRNKLFAFQPNPASPSGTPAPPWREAKVRLVDFQRNSLPHHPNTEAGHTAHQRQVAEYTRKHGSTRPDEYKAYPLTPGTELVASGACFTCGLNIPTKHNTYACTAAVKLHPNETRYRSIGAICYGITRGPPPPPTGSTVASVRMVDVTNEDEETLRELIEGGAFITEVDQGKGEGPSA